LILAIFLNSSIGIGIGNSLSIIVDILEGNKEKRCANMHVMQI